MYAYFCEGQSLKSTKLWGISTALFSVIGRMLDFRLPPKREIFVLPGC